MNRIILIGRSEAGKTTLTQALRGENIHYAKTQAVGYDPSGIVVDTPGEYIQTRHLGGALAVYAYESDVIGLLASATEPYSLFSPAIAATACRPVIGIVTKCDEPNANPDMAELWLKNSGCDPIFRVDSVTGRGIKEVLDYLHN